MSPAAQSTIDRLEGARQSWWIFSTLCKVVLFVLTSILLFLLFVLVDVLYRLPQSWLGGLLAIWCVASLAAFAGTAWRLLRYQRNTLAAARRVEYAFPQVGNDLVNLIQLSESADEDTGGFHSAAIEEITGRLTGIPFQRVGDRYGRWRRWRYSLQTPRDLAEFALALAAVVGVAFLLSAVVPTWNSSAQRLLTPWQFVPQTGRVEILEVTPGNAEVLLGSRLEIEAATNTHGARDVRASLLIVGPDGRKTEQAMVAGEASGNFRASIPAVLDAFRYQLQIGDSQSATYDVTVREKPRVEELEVTYRYPSYLGRPEQVLQQSHADLEGPQYTEAQLRIRCSSRLSRGYLQWNGRQVVGRVAADGHTLLAGVTLAEETNYTIHLFDELGHTDSDPRVNRVRVVPDQPPSVQLVRPPRETTAVSGRPLEVAVRAADDHGLTALRLETRPFADSADSAGEPAVRTVHQWELPAGASATTVTCALPLDSAEPAQREVFLLRAVARDTRRLVRDGAVLEPQEAASPWHQVRIVDPRHQADQQLAELNDLRARLWAVLQMQIGARLITARLNDPQVAPAADDTIAEVRRRQVRIRDATQELVDSLKETQRREESAWRAELVNLANAEMLQAIRLAEEAGGDTRLNRDAPVSLADVQDRIIEKLRRLLHAVRQSTSELLAEMPERPGADLPADTAGKLRDLAERLAELGKQQRRVIEATKELAKRPVEDFSEQQEQLLAELAATEDEWARFLEEVHSDFSKLPEQDFASPSLLEEIVEVQTELEMAADALTKKATDIAVPLEQLGAEMAEELTTNIEKWLPDTPDRERWSQEEPLADDMKQAPMAELPGELEDIVGELMEQEEDLFDELEDVSSSWADSLDKGAGWDAMDGPISNMSARGVTGNRLPNSSEIGGRSGEGRQGQASGEFVSDAAVGKGGRKTPSRLAPDPFVKGQVKDTSTDPVGGATGGGKESGVGGEGLEGPTPQQMQRELGRLAEKQAELRNQAESIDLQFQILHYHTTDLEKLIENMGAVQRDLQSGRYHSALRQRDVVLGGLQHLKTYVAGEFSVQSDRTINLPADIQQQLLRSMQEASPRGWEELNRKYFQRLIERDSRRAASGSAETGAAESAPGGTR